MTVNYIYGSKGNIEYAIIPYSEWKKLKQNISLEETESIKDNNKKFEPSEYRGILSDLNIDIEMELKNMRDQWSINI